MITNVWHGKTNAELVDFIRKKLHEEADNKHLRHDVDLMTDEDIMRIALKYYISHLVEPKICLEELMTEW